MSWDADLDGAGSWNYTHNTNRMIAAAYEAVTGETTEQAGGPLGPVIGAAWWKRLDGLGAKEGALYLDQIIAGLEADPARFEAMNPENGWGSYASLVQVLREMRDDATDLAATGDTTAVWRVSG